MTLFRPNLDFSKCCIFVGTDTRPSSPSLKQTLLHILNALAVNVIDMGQITTPQLHYAVFMHNYVSERPASSVNYLDLYNKNFSSFFNSFSAELQSISLKKCIVDYANGIGGPRLKEFAKSLKDLEVVPKSCGQGILNFECGADFVKSNNIAPYVLERFELSKFYYAGFDVFFTIGRLFSFFCGASKSHRIVFFDFYLAASLGTT